MNDTEYIIPEQFKLMGQLAGPISMVLSQRLHGKPDCNLVSTYLGTDYESFINAKMDDMQLFVPRLTDAVNDLGRCVLNDEVEPALDNVENVLNDILDSMDEVKCSPLQGMGEGKPLLLNLMGRVVQDTITQLQTLNQIVANPELSEGRAVIDLSVTYRVDDEMEAFEAWCNRFKKANSGFRWTSLLAGFGLGWWLMGNNEEG